MDIVLQTLRYFTKQCRQALEETSLLDLSAYHGIKNICICSMGASSFGYFVVKALFNDEMSVPILLNSDYKLPSFISKESLVILSSYSGGTEEVISNFKNALNKGASLIGLTQESSILGKLLMENNLPFYKIIPTYNPSGQPRMATGYSIIGLINILSKLNILVNKTQEILSAIDFIDKVQLETENYAKEIADKLFNRQVIIFGGEHLSGNAHILRNQFNESAKNFSDYFILPELNHHLLEGLSHPDNLKNSSIFLSFNSAVYSDRIGLRLKLTGEIVKKNKFELVALDVKGENKLEQVLYLTALGGFITYNLAQLNKEDPSRIPWVDFFKKELARHDER